MAFCARVFSFPRIARQCRIRTARRIVIPNKTGKKFPKYYLQPTLEIKIQRSKIETQVQHARPKEHFKESLTIHSNGQNTRATPKPPRTQKPKPGTRAI